MGPFLQNLMFFQHINDFTGFDTGFSQELVNKFLSFVIIDVLIAAVRHILSICRSQGLPLEE